MNLRRNPLLITLVACLLAMSVTPAVLAKDDGKPAASAVDAPLAAYEPVEIAFRNAPGHPEDFVMIVRKRALRFPVGAHIYLGSEKDGSLTFDGLPPGEYEAQLWGGERGRVIAKSPAFSVNGEWREPEEPTSVWAEKSFYAPDEAIVAHFADAWVREETDHLLLAPATTSEHRWPIRGVVSLTTPRGSLVFGRPRPGAYELRLYRGSSKEVVARFALSVGESLAATYPEMAGGTLAAAQGWRDRCEVLSDWATGYELPEQGTEMTALQVYTQPFADSAFVPVFGVPLDELKPETLEFIIKTVRPQCRELDRSYREALDYDVLGGFDADPHPMSRRAVTYESTVASVKQRRSADRLLAKGAARLDALAMDANAYAEVLRVEKRYVPTGWASAGAKEHFLDTLARTRTAAADMALEDGVGRLVATASGLEGAHRLDALQRDNARLISDASETVAAAALDRLEKAIGEQLQETLANYTTRLEQTGEGAEGVRAMARLYHEASDTLGGLMKREAVQPFMARFVERERALIPAAVPELVEDIASLPTLQASHDYRVRGLGRPEAWKLVENTQLPVALKKRQVELWAQLEASGEKIWPLPTG